MNIRGKEDPYLKIGEGTRRPGIKGKRSFESSRHSSQNGSDFIWALRDINLELEEGEVLGIIGKNGAGKSTLLRILSKVTAPTTGTIKARGRIASLLEVGTGFHPEMTGRENIYMNGAIMGMTKVEITRKLDEIIDFAGVYQFIDTPVKRYSSGMTVRLGFAVAAHLEHEILVVDEVLTVGDADFQRKAIGKMQDISKGEGSTVLFVSHNMGAVKNLCHSGILLENGKIVEKGGILSVIDKYLQDHQKQETVYSPIDNVVKEVRAIQTNDKIFLTLSYQSEVPLRQPNFGFIIFDNYDNPIFGTNPLKDGIIDFGEPKKDGKVEVIISAPQLVNGEYPVSVWFNDGIAKDQHIFHKDRCLYLNVSGMNILHFHKGSALGPVIPSVNYNFT